MSCPCEACKNKRANSTQPSPVEGRQDSASQPAEPAGLVERMYTAYISVPGMPSDKVRMTAALAVARAEFEAEMASLKENADFLRKSVGVCHLMISRDDLSELEKEQWEATTLPPRLKKYIEAKVDQQLQQKLDERDKEWEQAILEKYKSVSARPEMAEGFARDCCARLSPKAAKEPSLQEQIDEILARVIAAPSTRERITAAIHGLVKG